MISFNFASRHVIQVKCFPQIQWPKLAKIKRFLLSICEYCWDVSTWRRYSGNTVIATDSIFYGLKIYKESQRIFRAWNFLKYFFFQFIELRELRTQNSVEWASYSNVIAVIKICVLILDNVERFVCPRNKEQRLLGDNAFLTVRRPWFAARNACSLILRVQQLSWANRLEFYRGCVQLGKNRCLFVFFTVLGLELWNVEQDHVLRT